MNLRQLETNTLVRSFGLTFTQSSVAPFSSYDWDQLVVAVTSPTLVQSGDDIWLMERSQGLWLPDGKGCTFLNRTKTSVQMLYLPAWKEVPVEFKSGQSRMIHISPLLRELVQRVIQLGALKNQSPTQGRLAQVIWDEIITSRDIPPTLRHPVSEILCRVVNILEEENFHLKFLDQAVRSSGFSRRTLERKFVEETGLPLGTWLKKRRLMLAQDWLQSDQSVQDIAFALGYSSPSAFIAMYKQETGNSPLHM